MASTWYKAEFVMGRIMAVKLVKETESTVTTVESFLGGAPREERHKKVTDSDAYFPTFEEAKAAWVAKRQAAVERAEYVLADARKKLAHAQGVATVSES